MQLGDATISTMTVVPSPSRGPQYTWDGSKLYAARLARRLTVRALADLVGVSHYTVRYIETGKRRPSLELVGKLETALEMTAEELGATGLPPRPDRRPAA